MSSNQSSSDTDDRQDLEYVENRVAAVNEQAATAVSRASGLESNAYPVGSLGPVQSALAKTYAETRRALDRVEHVIDDRSDDHATPTPRQIKSEHSTRLNEQYDGPVYYLAVQLLESNRREWLHAKPDTYGAQQIERHGMTENQRSWLNDLQDAWRAYDGGDADA